MALGILAKVTIVFCAAFLLRLCLFRASASARHLLWVLAFSAALLVPIFSVALPQIGFSNSAALRISMPGVLLEVTAAASAGWRLPLLYIWLSGALLLLARLISGTARAAALIRNGRVPSDREDWTAQLAAAAGRIGIHRPIRLRESDRIAVPLTCSLPDPVVLLPAASREWTAERRLIVLLHELAHIRRHDCLTHLIAEVASVLFWFYPLVWWAARELRRERERACDDAVLNAGARPSIYASHLVEIARVSAGGPAYPTAALGIVPFLGRHSQLDDRVRAMLKPGVSRMPPARATVAVCAALLVLAMAPLSRMDTGVPRRARKIRVGGLVQAAHLLYMERPLYPGAAKSRAIEGTVLLGGTILENGSMGTLQVISSPDPILSESAVAAVRQWRYTPTLLNGVPIEVETTIRINFHLQK